MADKLVGQRVGLALLAVAFSDSSCDSHGPAPGPQQLATHTRERPPPSSPAAGAPQSAASINRAPAGSAATELEGTELHLLPSPAVGRKPPLVLLLHGLGSSGRDIARATDWARFLDAHGAAWLAPDGPRDRQGRRFWNAGPSCCDFDATPVDHVAMLSTLIERHLASGTLDPEKVFVIGFSNGGFMAHRLGCERPSLVRGIVSLAGAGPSPSEKCEVGKSLRVLEVHGDADAIVSYGGGHLFQKADMPVHLSALQTLADWGARLGCGSKPVAGSGLDFEARIPGAETSVLRYADCQHGAAELWTVASGSHFVGFRAPSQAAIWASLNPE